MKTTIGVIAPHDSLQLIMYVAKEFDEITFIPYPYEQLTEVSDILTKHRHEVDQWFFSGVLNYTYALENNLITEKEGTYPPLHGASFFGILLEAQLASNKVYREVSIDTIESEEFDKILSYYQLDSLTYYNHPFDREKSSDKLVEFHSKLYEEGKTEVAITSIKYVYRKLKERSIPVFRVTPSYLSIKMIIQYLEERAQSNLYRNSQVAVIGCRIEMDPDHLEELYYSFKTKYQELDVRRQLFSIAEKTNGSVMQMGDGLFFIFTTRGELSNESEADLFHLIDDIRAQTNLKVKVSIGFGETVLQAEQHVRMGFRHVKDYEKPMILIVDDDQSISLKEQKDQIAYQTTDIGQAWQDKLKDANLSPGVVSKILAYAKQYGRDSFSSQDLSRWLKSTERNGRRILSEMERVGIVEQAGENQSGERGRPRKVYKFLPLS
ncbi:hypothetical protein [Halobacillus mangrovi]|uniref:Transcriptional regulator n=1 Tax=Halobacillus mangrovi TaxID=402384 RepID=A0A1W5ZZ30_9BACI|nr:hypothetical protein [Halobacillus mangrovi]ARI78616.1 hypothetical protein HM131_17995 [Halobacillus mangrovi]